MTQLVAPCQSIDFQVDDIDGLPITLSELRGKPIILSFFRDAACPFCNLRVYEFTRNFQRWDELGIEVIAVFSSTADEVRQFVTKHPRPFKTIADPELELYKLYGLKSSVIGFIRALLFRFPQARAGVRSGGKTDVSNPNATLMPADFLIGFDGKIVDLWYGADVGDHIPMGRIDRFAHKVKLARVKKQAELRTRKMKQKISAHKVSAGEKPKALLRSR